VDEQKKEMLASPLLYLAVEAGNEKGFC